MKLHNDTSEIFIPDGKSPAVALPRITHLGIGAHQDDLEFMAFHGILQCFSHEDRWFGGITCTNGAGSARNGPYVKCSDTEMRLIRRKEQQTAAVIGNYGMMAQLDYPSSTVKSATDRSLKNDLQQLLTASLPEVVYTHNPADKHLTHVGVFIATIQAIRELPAEKRPRHVIGCEVWRDLDWLPDTKKVLMDVSGHDHLATALNEVFDSQIAGGKRYDLATIGRRCANATYFDSHTTDETTQLIFGIDLTPLIVDETRDIVEYVGQFIHTFHQDVTQNLNQKLNLS